MKEQDIKLRDFITVIKKKWWIIVLITAVVTGGMWAATKYIMVPKYQGVTKLFIGKQMNEAGVGYTYNDLTLYEKLLKSFAEAINTEDLISSALKNTSYDISEAEVLANLEVNTLADTQILQLYYTDEDPLRCKRILDIITDEFIKKAKDMVPNVNVQVLQSVKIPKYPISPNMKENLILAFLLGLIISFLIIFIFVLMDSTYKDKEQLEESLDIPVLGEIPISKNI